MLIGASPDPATRCAHIHTHTQTSYNDDKRTRGQTRGEGRAKKEETTKKKKNWPKHEQYITV